MDVAVLDTPYPALRAHLSAQSPAAAATLDLHVTMLKRAAHLGHLTGAPGQWQLDNDGKVTSQLVEGWVADWQTPVGDSGAWSDITSATLTGVRVRSNQPLGRSERQ